ncbi:MAG: histidine phosphatase family protein [Solobacterium sp.]|nr:histidine phosphatase family protein [Solobacterium sp.]
MRLLIIRHGEPDYIHDTLTEKGWREAELLSSYLVNEKIDSVYVSPLGRARDTASLTLQKRNQDAEVLEWLKEFEPRIHRPDKTDKKTRTWDWLPEDWTKYPEFYLYDAWYDHPVMQEGHVKEAYLKICKQFDLLLKDHGYEREGKLYNVVHGNHDTIALFCHFGLECVLLSHLLSISPMPLWHGYAAAPSSVTTVYTEERREGKASFRIQTFGSVTHLYVGKEEPSFAARYAECFHD